MKLFLGIILLIICVFIGYIKSNKYYYRRVFYEDFLRFNDKLKQEVAFKQCTIKSILDSENIDTDFIACVKNVFLNNNEFSFNQSYLTENEIRYYSDYLSKIGVGDKSLQINFLQSVNEEVGKIQNQCVSDEIKYKKLYIKLGFFIGLILLILVL